MTIEERIEELTKLVEDLEKRTLERHERGPVNPETFAACETGNARPARAVIGFNDRPERLFRFATS